MNAYTMPRRKRGQSIEPEREFRRGEFVLSRRMMRWLEPRISAETSNDFVLCATRSLARLILQKHADPRVAGRDFYLCREGLPKCFADEKGELHSEWHLRLAKAVLLKIGFIERVTPVAEKRFFKFKTKDGETVRREGRWLPAVRQHVKPGQPKGFRAPKVLFRLTTVTLGLLAKPKPGDRIPAASPEYKDHSYQNESRRPNERYGEYTGGSSAVVPPAPPVRPGTPPQVRAVLFENLDAQRRAVKQGFNPFGGIKLGDFRKRGG